MAERDEKPELCRLYRGTGKCRFEDQCKYRHVFEKGTDGQCFLFLDDKKCPFGEECRYSHGPDGMRRRSRARSEKLTDAQGKEICRAFKQEGMCRYVMCKYSHLPAVSTKKRRRRRARKTCQNKSSEKETCSLREADRSDDQNDLAPNLKAMVLYWRAHGGSAVVPPPRVPSSL